MGSLEQHNWTTEEKTECFERLLHNGNWLHAGDKERVSYVRRSCMCGGSN